MRKKYNHIFNYNGMYNIKNELEDVWIGEKSIDIVKSKSLNS